MLRLRVGMPGALALMASIALHALFIEAILLGEGGSVVRHKSFEGLGANLIEAEDVATATLIFIEEPSTASSRKRDLEKVASAGKVLQNLRVTIVSPEPNLDKLVDSNDAGKGPDAVDESASGDRLARAALFGRYIGQIQARVERAWLRPRTPPGTDEADDTFECRVQLLQDKRGEVLEVTLQQCLGPVDWQVSLVHAIEQSSPLPAPPDPAVFADSLELVFRSRGFDSERNQDGFALADLRSPR